MSPLFSAKRKKIAVLGGGSWGTALAVTFAEHHDVLIWEFDPEAARQVESDRRNKAFLPMVAFPDSVHVTNVMDEAIDGAAVVVYAVPSHVLRQVARQTAALVTRDQLLVTVVKGVEQDTLMRMSEVIADCVPQFKAVVALTGPTHAEEVGKKIPSAIVAASARLRDARAVQRLFMTPNFRIYTNNDVIGAEVSAALKNVVAIAAGICDGLAYGDNTKAALITRGLAEIKRLGMKMGAREETFSGLAGMGDLIVTCMSKFSRNRKVGMLLGHGRSLEDILKEMNQVAEGVKNTKSALSLAKKYEVELPIASAVGAVLFGGMPASKIGQLLMTRAPRDEFY
jgi:glycerol-3-phosphate dehydrogenase (NAD(P)+)